MMGLQCNVRCTMCYQTDFSPRFNMPDALWRDRLRDAYPHVKGVKLQGGEPTIMKNCRDAAEMLRAYPGIKLTIISNGVFIDDFWHETLVEQGGVFSVSINAATEPVYDKIVVHGEYGRVVRNVERVLAHRRGRTPKVLLTAVVLKENFAELVELVELGGRMGVDSVELLYDPILSFTKLPGRAAVVAQLRRCEEARARFPDLAVIGMGPLYRNVGLTPPGETKAGGAMCTAPWRNIVVDWDGTVRVCCNTWVKIGNLHESSLAEIWAGPIVDRFRRKLEGGSYVWCAPDCADNPAPSRLSLAHKYAYNLGQDPELFIRKISQKLKQLNGTWVTLRKRSRPLAEPKRVRLPVVEPRP
jgi:MoaA/NifB/PqqE/SkfB family radical SAM enzyme